MVLKLLRRILRAPTVGKPTLIRINDRSLYWRDQFPIKSIWTRKGIYLCRTYKLEVFLGWLLTAAPCAVISYLLCINGGSKLLYELMEKYLPTIYKSSIENGIEKVIENYEKYILKKVQQKENEPEPQRLAKFQKIRIEHSTKLSENASKVNLDDYLGENPNLAGTIIVSYAFYSLLELPRDICMILTAILLIKRRQRSRLARLMKNK